MVEEKAVRAVVLTGGRSSRMGGRHKPGILVDGRPVIERILSTLWSAAPSAEVVIAGSDTGLSPSLQQKVTVVREEPHFSGPVAGVAAALEVVSPSEGVVLLLGGDLPFLSSTTLQKLLSVVIAEAPVASCVDATGHLQYLCSGWQQSVLLAQLEQIENPIGVPLRALFEGLTPEVVDCDPDELRDIDTPDDLARAVTTSDGRPVPEALLTVVERFCQHGGSDGISLTAQQTAAILDFAREVKYSGSAANPAVAAFLAGQLAGSQSGTSTLGALQQVLSHINASKQRRGQS